MSATHLDFNIEQKYHESQVIIVTEWNSLVMVKCVFIYGMKTLRRFLEALSFTFITQYVIVS